jgi:predicted O-linked N-acetylglucosamine transferase (SPINDLY family)
MEEALSRIRQLVEAEPNSETRHSEQLGLLCADPSATEESLFRASSAWARCLAVTPDFPARRKFRRPPRPRLGFFSSSFHGHVISRFFLPLLAALPRDGFESVHLFHDGPVQDEITSRLRTHADNWTNIHPLPDRAAQEKIAAAEIDILVDLNGHFDLSRLRLFAQPLAPVMVHYLGGACTTGLRTIGYRIADSIAEPPGESDRWSTETILRLPRGFHCYAPLHPTAEPSPSPARTNGSLTFGTTAALYKLNLGVLQLWGKLLEQVPGSRLLVIKEAFADSGTREDVARRFAAAGISAGQFELRPASREAFTRGETWAEIDVALDPFPYNGVTTTCEALWMGVPVVALRGRRLIARTAASILTHLGRPEWVAEDAEHYVAIAAGLAAGREKLASVRAGLRSEVLASPLGQPRIVAADLADALLKTVEQ